MSSMGTVGTAPGTPTGLSISSTTSSSVQLDWSPPYGGSAIDNYKAEANVEEMGWFRYVHGDMVWLKQPGQTLWPAQVIKT